VSYRIIRQLESAHIPQLLELYRGEFWCNSRQQADVLRMLDNTDIVVGLVNEHNTLCGFCRLLSDFVYKATLYDFIVAPTLRNQGLGVKLLDYVLQLPELAKVEHIDLNCLDSMLAYYQRFGFSEELDGLRHMRRFN
jgi:predicted N-acetyltransferase YhbS